VQAHEIVQFVRLDAVDKRLDRIERRLGLIDAEA
jgi:hypothetical protein